MASELCIVDARILTMNSADEVAEAMRVVDGGIVQVGTTAEVLAAKGAGAEVVELAGATVIPGLIDAHSHIEMLAYAWEIAVDVRSPGIASIEQLVSVMAQAAQDVPAGRWIMGHGQHFQDVMLAEGRYPDRHDLDRVSAEHPVFYRSSYHLNVFNSRALEVLGVDRDTPDARGGRIERDEQGEPTGRTYDMFDPLGGPQAPVPELADAIARVQQRYLAVGVTALGEISLRSHGFEAMLALAARDDFRLRATLYATSPSVVDAEAVRSGGLRARFAGLDESRLRLGGVKLFLDGGLTSNAAALSFDYPSLPGYRGELAYTDEEIAELVRLVDEADLQLSAHAIGDRALDQVLAALDRLPAESRRRRHRIEHAGNIWMTPERIAKLVELGAVPVPQPAFILTTALGYRRNLGEVVGTLMPFRTLLDAGLSLPGNSDAIGITADQHDPFPAIQASVTRMTHAGEPVDPAEAITVVESLGMYTRDAAFAIGRETEIGSLEPGKRADFAVLDEDLLAIDPAAIGAVRPRSTWIDGTRVFSRD
ncbi:MAG: hypothetical protein BGO95_05670 [Micrococcales bacterium 73-13]|nr:MAG: hypothetical protein BGO95_05670 [Micrococcales bacterium 73-13]